MSESVNNNAVVPFVRPDVKSTTPFKPQSTDGQAPPPETRQFTIRLSNETVVVLTGLLMFMPPFVGVGNADGSVVYLANPEKLIDITIDTLPSQVAA